MLQLCCDHGINSATFYQGRSIRLFKGLDNFNRQGLGIDADLSLPSDGVIHELEQSIEWRGRPIVIRCDNGPQYISGTLPTKAAQQGIGSSTSCRAGLRTPTLNAVTEPCVAPDLH